ncbi:DUF6282 family protein [Phytohabitans suffuscus]|uniref:Cytosolic protein n=1 Tax=Phytohabitans suffuscus TaxID=624315 RepID=A0A6F8YTJ5_9ACTN|nr:DUF6282 family protein [Phytohabitans suffuscus]BCB89434.1 hypothetical protein Psuf_067470 [Phytohabitans suffuscus]
MGVVENLLSGAVDLHCHSGPSPMPRRVTHVEAARQAAGLGFRAVVAKCHYHDTVTDVLAMAPQLAGVPTEVFGGIALNSQVGGLNPHAVDRSLRMGGRVIWFPTISSPAHLDHAAQHEEMRRHFQPLGMMRSDEVAMFGDDGDLRPEVHKIIAQAKEAGALISTGHLGPEAARALVEAAAAAGHRQLILSHPNFVANVDPEDVVALAGLGAVIEHELGMYHLEKKFPIQVLLDWINLVGPEHTSLGSDLGQVGNPLPVEGYLGVVERLLDSGVPERDIRLMVRDNPARLIGLEL